MTPQMIFLIIRTSWEVESNIPTTKEWIRISSETIKTSHKQIFLLILIVVVKNHKEVYHSISSKNILILVPLQGALMRTHTISYTKLKINAILKMPRPKVITNVGVVLIRTIKKFSKRFKILQTIKLKIKRREVEKRL